MPLVEAMLTNGLIACGAGKPKRRRQSIPETRTSSRVARNANIEGAGKSFPCPPEAKKYPQLREPQ